MPPIDSEVLRPPGFYHQFLDRGIPLLVAASVILILAVSNVPPNLYLVSGMAAEAVLAVYVCVMLALSIQPDRLHIHMIALPLGLLTWAGRGGGFLELVLAGRTDLGAAVGERLDIAILVSVWHFAQVRWHAALAQASRRL